MDQERTGSGRTRPADFCGRLRQNLWKQGQLVTGIVKKSRHPTLLDAVPKKVWKNWKKLKKCRWIKNGLGPVEPDLRTFVDVCVKTFQSKGSWWQKSSKNHGIQHGSVFLIGIPFRHRKQGVRSRRVWTEKTKVMTIGESRLLDNYLAFFAN